MTYVKEIKKKYVHLFSHYAFMANHYHISAYKLSKSKDKRYRNITIYLLKEYTGLTNRQISEFMRDINKIMSNVKKFSISDFNDQLYFMSEVQNV